MDDVLPIDEIDSNSFDAVFGVEPQGFILGSSIAHNFGKPFAPIRKKGKLPGEVLSIHVGDETWEIHKEVLVPGHKVVIIDTNTDDEKRLPAIEKALRAEGLVVLRIKGI